MSSAEKKKMSKPLKITLIVLSSLIAFMLLVWILAYTVESIIFADFYSNADSELVIPGLWGQSVPQGFEYISEIDTFLYTGYAKDKISPSMEIDATGCYLPENTWFVEGQYHGQYYYEEYTRKLVTKLLFTDDIKDVYSDPEFPQETPP